MTFYKMHDGGWPLFLIFFHNISQSD